MILKVRKSLAYRLPLLYKRILKFRSYRFSEKKESVDQTILMMVGVAILDMTKLSLFSILKYWNSVPKLIIVSDGSLSLEKIEKELLFWPGEIEIKSWETTSHYHKNKNRTALINYANEHVLGRKLAVILHYAAFEPVIWIDSDILFFSDFNKFIPVQTGFFCGGSEESHSLYDERILDYYKVDLYKKYTFSSGLLYINGTNIYEEFDLEGLLTNISTYTHYFSEQTIFAYIADQSLGILWDKELIKNNAKDHQELLPNQEVIIGRHYTKNVRHLFWRDAFLKL